MAKQSNHSLVSDDATEFFRENFGTEKLAPKYGGNGLVTEYHKPTPDEIKQAEELREQLDPSKNHALVSAYRKALG